MIDLYFVFNGHRRVFLGRFDDKQCAVVAMKEHQAVNSAIRQPRYVGYVVADGYRVDYGALDCFYLMVPNVEVKND